MKQLYQGPENPNVYQAVLEEEEEGERAPLDRAQANLQNELVSPIPPAPPCQRRRPASTMMFSGVCRRKRGIWSNRELTKFQTFKKEMKPDN